MRTLLTLMLIALLAACRGENVRSKPVSQSNEPPQAPAATFQASTGTPQAAVPPTGSVTGKILETMDSGRYTYLKLSVGGGEVWAAVNQSKVEKGSTVTVVNAMRMDGFESKTLHRTFDRILFGTLAEGSNGGVAPEPRVRQMMGAQHAAAA